jgi:hypothetical protein
MANQAGLLTKQSLPDAIAQQLKLASELIALEAAQFREPGGRGRVVLGENAFREGTAHKIVLLLKLQLGRHVPYDHVPTDLVSSVTYRLSVLAHSAGPVWTRIDREVVSSNPDLTECSQLPSGWDLLSETGDLSSLDGMLWPDLPLALEQDLSCIVPDQFAEEFLDGDLTAKVEFDPAFWVAGNCRSAAPKIHAV